MEPLELNRRDARRIAILAQGLDAGACPEATEGTPARVSLDDIRSTVAALDSLPMDFTPTIAPAHHHILASRLGADFDPGDLTELVESRRTLFELDGAIRPIESLPSYRPVMASYPPYESWSTWFDDNAPFRDDVLRRLADDAPLAATEIDDTSIRPWRSSGWTAGKNVQRMLDLLERRGEIAVAEHRGVVRLFDLAERIYPTDQPRLTVEEASEQRMRRRLAAGGILRPRGRGTQFEAARPIDAGVTARVDGVRGAWRVDEAALDRLGGFTGRTALLSPLDRLVFDRTRLAELFESEYTLEMYKPKAKRRWGYFALPILSGDRIVGKADATLEPDAGRLRVDAIHEDSPFDRALAKDVRNAVDELAAWLRVRVVYR